MSTKKPYRGYYRWLTGLLVGSFLAAEASLFGALYYSTTLPDPPRENQSVLLLMLVPLAIILLPLLWRTLGASNAAHAPNVVHQALTPERIYILGCSLFALATLMSTLVTFDPTIWGLLLSVAIIGPLVSYAQHIGELRRILKPKEPRTGATGDEPSAETELLSENRGLRAHIQEIRDMSFWQRVRGQFPPVPRASSSVTGGVPTGNR